MSRKKATEVNPLFGERLKILRTDRKETQKDVGEVIGVQDAAVRKYEKGLVGNIPAESIKKLANHFDVDPSYLMGWSSKRSLNKTIGGGGEVMEDIAIYRNRLKSVFGEQIIFLLDSFANLNDEGREEAKKRIGELTNLEQYKVQDGSSSVQDE